MKTPISVTLIVCGTILIALPYINSMLGTQQVVETMAVLGKSVNLSANLPRNADTICMIGGFLMILVGAISGRKGTSRDADA